MKELAVIAAFAPLIGAIVAGLGGRWVSRQAAHSATIFAVLLSFLCSCVIFYDVLKGETLNATLYRWMSVGDTAIQIGFLVDRLTALMMIVVTFVSLMVHVYTIGYMHDDPGYKRFFAYISLFTFSMLMLVMANNFVQLFFGWEAVGLVSYLLIGFWYTRPTAIYANLKAFLVNRVGDFGFLLGIALVLAHFGTLDYAAVFPAAEKADAPITLICILLFIGAMGKSAQFPLHVWLPDSMEGPTPISALIHAATMVTAGVFMVARLSPMFEYAPDALAVVTVVGATTAIFAASVGLVQNDIKRVIAYSTCSQLGYMFFAAGVSAYAAAIFHLMTHAFFKALLFLGSGSVIHALHGEQDMRKMGGLRRVIPITHALMWIGSLSLAGIGIPFVFGFAGFYSKDIVVESAFAAHSAVGQYAFWLGIVAALMTAFYSWRLLFMTFFGAARADRHAMEHAHESPNVMLVPLYVLAVGAVFAGWLGYSYFVGHDAEHFWGESIKVLPQHNSIEAAHHGPAWVGILPLIVGLIGIGIAYGFYIRDPARPAAMAKRWQGLYRFLLNKWYFDEIYDVLFVRTAFWLGRRLWKKGDGAIIDGLGPDGIAARTLNIAQGASRLQTGYVYHYAFAMLIGVVLITSWYLFRPQIAAYLGMG
jgi:NADH-quinone oxidoreductase subunit L